jgi:hypothetical protein
MKFDLLINIGVDFKKFCGPAKLYLLFSVLSCIIMLLNGISILAVFSKLLFAFLWTLVLSWLCHKGYKSVSWFLVLLPFIMMVLVSFRIMRHMSEINKLNPMTN